MGLVQGGRAFLQEGTPEFCFQVRTQQKRVCLQARKGALTKTESAGTLISDLPSPES